MNDTNPMQNFSGTVPLFPLPNIVLFPNTLIPLHIFEKRYRIMLKDALRGEKLIGMTVLKPGWEEQYDGNPAIYPVACVGTIVKHDPYPDGRSNIFLLGLKRAHIQTIVAPRPYRKARVIPLEDSHEGLTQSRSKQFRNELLELYGEYTVTHAGGKRKLPPLSDTDIDLAALTDAVAAAVGLPVRDQVHLLEEVRVGRRAEYVIERLRTQLRKDRPSVVPHMPVNPLSRKIYLN